jgi:hypothetical protein
VNFSTITDIIFSLYTGEVNVHMPEDGHIVTETDSFRYYTIISKSIICNLAHLQICYILMYFKIGLCFVW